MKKIIFKQFFIINILLVMYTNIYGYTENFIEDINFLEIPLYNVNGKSINEEIFKNDHIIRYGENANILNQEYIKDYNGNIVYKYLPEDYNGKIKINNKYLFYNQKGYNPYLCVFSESLMNYLSWIRPENILTNKQVEYMKYSNINFKNEENEIEKYRLKPFELGLYKVTLVETATLKKHGYIGAVCNKDKTNHYFYVNKMNDDIKIEIDANILEENSIKSLNISSKLKTNLEKSDILKYEVSIYKNDQLFYRKIEKNIKENKISQIIDDVTYEYKIKIRVATIYKNDGVYEQEYIIPTPENNTNKIEDIKVGRLSCYNEEYYFENREFGDTSIFQGR